MNQKLILGIIAVISIVSAVCLIVYSNRTEVGWAGAVDFVKLTDIQKQTLDTYFDRSMTTSHYAIFILGLFGLLVGTVVITAL